MIDKADFYHGAALVRVVEDTRCQSIAQRPSGYLVNGHAAVCLKYTTKTHSPWRFTLTVDDVRSCESAIADQLLCVVVLVCGGDGICVVPWNQLSKLVGLAPAWITSKRSFKGSYAVSAANGTLPRRVARNQWPAILFPED